jgi:hypothetical protein
MQISRICGGISGGKNSGVRDRIIAIESASNFGEMK